MDKLSILHLTTFLQGGAGKILCSLAVQQKKEGNQVVVAGDGNPCEGYEDYPEYIKLLQLEDIHRFSVHSLFRRSFNDNLQAAVEIKKIMMREKINIVHANAAIPALIGLIARSSLPGKIPVVLSMQGWGLNKTLEQEKTDITISNLIDAVFPVSFAAKNLLRQKGVVNKNMVVIHNGIDTKIGEICDGVLFTELRDMRSRGIPIVGCIGSLCERKDQATLLKAVACNELNHTQVVLIGEGNSNHLADLARELGIADRTIFAGYRRFADGYLPCFDILVLPSRSEGLPLVILEAFREHIPVIGSDIPEICEIVKEGETGYVFKVGNADDLRRKILVSLNQSLLLRKKMCDSAHSLYRLNHTTDKMYLRYAEQYNRLIISKN